MRNEYELMDSGEGRKLERFGDVILSRPCEQADWSRQTPVAWSTACASFDRDAGWQPVGDSTVPESWTATINDLVFQLSPTPAGHVGVFPETRGLWNLIHESLKSTQRDNVSVLNLFAYSGGATLAAARAGSTVCHLDASRSMVTRARENASLNGLSEAPIRWIVEDVGKFLDREIRRGRRYDAIMLDPPSFGRGIKGEQYKLERDLQATLEQCRALLSETPLFVLLTAHTQGMTSGELENRLSDVLDSGEIDRGTMDLTGAPEVRRVESGMWARWSHSVRNST